MGNSYDAMFRKFEQHENATRFTAGMTPAERGDFYGRMSVRIQNYQNAQLAQGLSGTPNLPAVVTNPTGGTPNLPAVIQGNLIPSIPAQAGDVLETATKNEGFKVVKKWASKDGKTCYLADKTGTFYKVDKATYNAAKVGKAIKPAEASAVAFDKLPAACQRQFRRYLPTPAEAATATVTTPKNTNPSHSTNTTLGTAKADPTDWTQRTGKTNFNDGPKWGGAETNKVAQQTIASNRVQTPNHNYNVVNDPQAYRNSQQAMYGGLMGKGEQVPMHNYNLITEPAEGLQTTLDKKFRIGDEVIWKEIYKDADDVADDAGKVVHNHYHNHKTVINKIDDVRINELTDKVDDIGNEVGKVKRGMGEAFGKTIAKIDDLGQNVDDIGKNVNQLTDKVDDIATNVGKVKRGMGEAFGKTIAKIDDLGQNVDDIGKNVNQLTDKVDDIATNVDKLKRGLGEVSGKIIAKVDDNADAIKTLTNKVDDMAKTNKKMALVGGAIALVGIAAAGIAGYFIGKSNEDEKAEGTKPEGTQPEVIEVPDENVVPPVIIDGEDEIPGENDNETPEIPDGNDNETPVIPGGDDDETPEIPGGDENETPEVPDNNNNNEHNPILNTDGTFTVGRGVKNGTFWGIAEQILEWTYRNEPDKFKNLSVNQRNVMIQKETDRLMELNKRGKKEVTVNGKTWIVPEPTIHPGDKIKTQEEKAA